MKVRTIPLTKAQGTPGRQMITYEGFDGSNDKFTFNFWLSQFITMIDAGRPMDSKYRLLTLRNHLTKRGLEFKLISNLEINDANFDAAIQMLKEDFSDEDKEVNLLYNQILVKNPKMIQYFRV